MFDYSYRLAYSMFCGLSGSSSPVCLQLAKVGSHAFAERSFRRRRVCDVCKQSIDNPGAFCKGESTSCTCSEGAADQHEHTHTLT